MLFVVAHTTPSQEESLLYIFDLFPLSVIP